jgi:hypothetical protein
MRDANSARCAREVREHARGKAGQVRETRPAHTRGKSGQMREKSRADARGMAGQMREARQGR